MKKELGWQNKLKAASYPANPNVHGKQTAIKRLGVMDYRLLAQAKYTCAPESRSWSVTKDIRRCASVRTDQRDVPVPKLSGTMV